MVGCSRASVHPGFFRFVVPFLIGLFVLRVRVVDLSGCFLRVCVVLIGCFFRACFDRLFFCCDRLFFCECASFFL